MNNEDKNTRKTRFESGLPYIYPEVLDLTKFAPGQVYFHPEQETDIFISSCAFYKTDTPDVFRPDNVLAVTPEGVKLKMSTDCLKSLEPTKQPDQ